MQEKIGFILEGGFACTACLSRDEECCFGTSRLKHRRANIMAFGK